MSARAIVCTNCGAGLEPKVLETRVKCTYCETFFVIVRDADGVSGLAPDGTTPGAPTTTAAPTTATAMSPIAPPPATIAGINVQTIERIERDAVIVAGALEVASEVFGAGQPHHHHHGGGFEPGRGERLQIGAQRNVQGGCSTVVFLAIGLATAVIAAVVA